MEKADMLKRLKISPDKVLIQLDEMLDTETQNGILIPHSDVVTTEGGRFITVPSAKKYLKKGTILLSENPLYPPNTKVYVTSTALSYEFPIIRNTVTQIFDGTILIPTTLIEATYE